MKIEDPMADAIRYGGLAMNAEPDGDDGYVVELVGELDMYTSPQLQDLLGQLLDDPELRRLVLDLGSMEFIDSTGLGVAVGALKAMLKRGGDLVLRSPRPGARRALAITSLDRIFDIED